MFKVLGQPCTHRCCALLLPVDIVPLLQQNTLPALSQDAGLVWCWLIHQRFQLL